MYAIDGCARRPVSWGHMHPEIDDITGPAARLKENGGKYRTGKENGKAHVKKTGELSHTTRLARDLFLFGNGDGRPVRKVERLSELSGAAIKTIWKYMGEWKREAEELARGENAGRKGQVASVTEQVVQYQRERVALLKEELDRLAIVIPKLIAGSDSHRDSCKLYAALLARWEESSGFTAYADCQASYAKELARVAARQQGKTDAETERNVTPGFSFAVVPSNTEKV